jgi:hypothetical protein
MDLKKYGNIVINMIFINMLHASMDLKFAERIFLLLYGNETLSQAHMDLKFHCTMVFRTVSEAWLYDHMDLKYADRRDRKNPTATSRMTVWI